MNQDLSIIALVTQASLVVQLVMAALLIVSVASWSVIFTKFFGLGRVRKANDQFETEFWSGRNLNELYVAAGKRQKDGAPLERIFQAGMREFLKLRERKVVDVGSLLDGARRAMRASYQREVDALESNLSFLASVGSVSPYVGLFGTVWGIMHAFRRPRRTSQQVTLATQVAPGIAEALVATAIGLFARHPGGRWPTTDSRP
jgi:biopolymer transport protein TolQ